MRRRYSHRADLTLDPPARSQISDTARQTETLLAVPVRLPRGVPTDGKARPMLPPRDNTEILLTRVRGVRRVSLLLCLRWAERAINEPFTAEASDQLDSALVRGESVR